MGLYGNFRRREIENAMNKHIYLDVLKNNLRPSAEEKLGLNVNYYFQQDNDFKPTA